MKLPIVPSEDWGWSEASVGALDINVKKALTFKFMQAWSYLLSIDWELAEARGSHRTRTKREKGKSPFLIPSKTFNTWVTE